MATNILFMLSVAYMYKNNHVSNYIDLFSQIARVVARNQQNSEEQSTLDLPLGNMLIA